MPLLALTNDVMQMCWKDSCLFISTTSWSWGHFPTLVLRRLLKKCLLVKAEKCEFHAHSLTFLSFIIQQSQLSPYSPKVHAEAKPVHPPENCYSSPWALPTFTRASFETYSKGTTPPTILMSTLQFFHWINEAEAEFVNSSPQVPFWPIWTQPPVHCGDWCLRHWAQRHPRTWSFIPAPFSVDCLRLGKPMMLESMSSWLLCLHCRSEYIGWRDQCVVWTDHKNLTYPPNVKQ